MLDNSIKYSIIVIFNSGGLTVLSLLSQGAEGEGIGLFITLVPNVLIKVFLFAGLSTLWIIFKFNWKV